MNEASGLGDPIWMSKMIIAHSPALYLRKAVIELIDAYESQEVVNAYESIDRLVQVAATGNYEPGDFGTEYTTVAEFGLNEDGTISEDLSEEDEEKVSKFRDLLKGLWTKEEDDEEENE